MHISRSHASCCYIQYKENNDALLALYLFIFKNHLFYFFLPAGSCMTARLARWLEQRAPAPEPARYTDMYRPLGSVLYLPGPRAPASPLLDTGAVAIDWSTPEPRCPVLHGHGEPLRRAPLSAHHPNASHMHARDDRLKHRASKSVIGIYTRLPTSAPSQHTTRTLNSQFVTPNIYMRHACRRATEAPRFRVR